MSSGDYTAVGGGALKLKGGKIQKKKKKRDKSDLETKISTGETALAKTDPTTPVDNGTKSPGNKGDQSEDDVPVARRTESERKYEETRKKRVSTRRQKSAARKLTANGTAATKTGRIIEFST
jgi:protein FAM32A